MRHTYYNLHFVLIRENPIGLKKLIEERIKPKNELHNVLLQLEFREKKLNLYRELSAEVRNKYFSIARQFTLPELIKEPNSDNPLENIGVNALIKQLENLKAQHIYISDYQVFPQGFDLIAMKKEGNLFIGEAKATTKKIKPLYNYLNRSCKKGRQLSWEWCWNSLIELSRTPYGSEIFLKTYRNFIQEDVERIVVITKCRLNNLVYEIEDTQIFKEEDIVKIPEPKNFLFENLQKQLREIEREKY